MPPRRRRPRGHIEQLPSGRYRARVYAGRDPLTNKDRYLLESAPDYEAAQKAATRLQRQVDEDQHPKSNLTVGQAVEQWLEVAALEETTRERYDDLIRLYVLPTFGHLQAAKLDAELLERFYARLHRCRDMCTGRPRAGHTCRPLSTSTTRKVHYIIRGALERAVRWRHLGVNKAAMAVRPVAGAHRARPASRRRGRAAAERRVERPGVGSAACGSPCSPVRVEARSQPSVGGTSTSSAACCPSLAATPSPGPASRRSTPRPARPARSPPPSHDPVIHGELPLMSPTGEPRSVRRHRYGRGLMAEISLSTVRWSPRSAHVMTVRTSATEPPWTDVPGVFAAGRWRFAVPDGRQDLKFVLDGELWETGPNRSVDGNRAFEEAQVAFPRPRIATESGRIAAEIVPATRGHQPRVVVIGSGMGGGVLADELSDLGIDVLVLEAGSYLLPGHAGNIPRKHRIGAFSKHIWELFDVFKSINYTNDPASGYVGGQGYNLGGRSIFWGGLIPRMGRWELSGWPAAVRDDLGAGRYTQAEDLMNATAPQTERQDDVLTKLQQRLPDHRHRNAPVAVQYRGARGLSLPGGLFSTADLLLESLQVVGPDERKLRVNLHHEVLRLETAGDRVTRVHYRDHLAGVEGAVEADVVVLAAGTVESATLALRSGLADPSGLVGVGMTDHPIYFTHFALPPASPFAGGSAKTWTWPLDAGSASGQYNLVLEIGSDFNQNRFVDDDTLRRHQELRGGVGLGEVVALFNAPLVEENWLRLDDAGRPVIRMIPAPVAPEAMTRAQDSATKVLTMVGAEELPGKDLDLQPALLGGVAHEVGTLRMGGDGAADGVVTSDLQYRGYDNLYVCDLSVFPSSPAANPSLTLVALAHRLARHLAGVLA